MVAVFTNSVALANKRRIPRRLKIAGVETVPVVERGVVKNKSKAAVARSHLKKNSLPSFKLIEVSGDNYLAYQLDNKLVSTGLDNGETVVLISIEESGYVMNRLVKSGLDVELLRSQWKFIVYTLSEDQVQPEGLLDFASILSDIKVIARGEVGRIICPDLDLLLSLEDPQLAYKQLKAIYQAAYEEQVKLITHYQIQQGFKQKVMERISQAVVSSYFVANLIKVIIHDNELSTIQLIPKKFMS